MYKIKPENLKRMQNSLINGWGNYNEVQRMLKRLYVNRDCLSFCKQLSSDLKSGDNAILILLTLKALLAEIHRVPDIEHYRAFREEYNQFFREIKHEQKACDPIKWIDSMIELLMYKNVAAMANLPSVIRDPKSKMLTTKEVMSICKISKSTLDRWIVNGLEGNNPGGGRKRYFEYEKVLEWQRTA